MSFVTKLDYSNNRQIKQYLLTDTQLSGTTTFGVIDALIPESVTADTINIDALQYIQARGLILPNSLPLFTGTTSQLLARDNDTGKIVEIELTGITFTGGADYVTSGVFSATTGDLILTRVSGGTVVTNLDGRYLTGYTLSAATDTVLGGVKIDNDTITISGGTITSNFGVKAIDEGNGIGFVRANRDATYYANVGQTAFDMSNSTATGTTMGASGPLAVAFGLDNIASGYGSFTQGYLNIAAANFSTSLGYQNTISGTAENAIVAGYQNTATGYGTSIFGYLNSSSGSFAMVQGRGNSAGGYSDAVFGTYNTTSTPSSSRGYRFTAGIRNVVDNIFGGMAIGCGLWNSALGCTVVGQASLQQTGNANVSTTPMFVVGNGDFNYNIGVLSASTRSDAFKVFKGGSVTAPTLTTAIINAEATGRVLTTREWVTGHTATLGKRIVSSGVTTSYNFDHSLANDWKIYMTGNTTFTDSNLPSGDTTIEFSIKITGNFVPTWPTYWTVVGDTYDGTIWNFIAVQIHDGNSGTEEATVFISNLV